MFRLLFRKIVMQTIPVGKSNSLRLVISRVGESCLSHYGAARTPLNTPEEVYKFWQNIIAADTTFECDREHLVTILVDVKLKPVGYHVVSVGGLCESIAHPREIFKAAIIASAWGLILAHNHPSGDPTPSEADRRVTNRIKDAGELLQIRVLDHVICGDSEGDRLPYYSFREFCQI